MRRRLVAWTMHQSGAILAPMTTKAAHKDSRARLERFTVRLPAEMVEAIDAECSHRAGNVSRNTWITEAVQEKLARNRAPSRSTGAGEGA